MGWNKGKTHLTNGDFTGFVDHGCGRGCVRSLDCPFAVCIHDQPPRARPFGVDPRRIVEMLDRRTGTRATARALGISTRTVLRARERVKEAS
jgi:hypothetical protein